MCSPSRAPPPTLPAPPAPPRRFLEDPEVRQALDVQADGLYLYRHMLVPGLPGLAFVGAEVRGGDVFTSRCKPSCAT